MTPRGHRGTPRDRRPAVALVLFLTVAALWASAATALGVRVRLDVVNPVAPAVALTEPRDGARVAAGRPLRIRAVAEGHDTLEIVVGGAAVASTADPALAATVTPAAPGALRIVAVARAAGRPEALAEATVTVTSPGPGTVPEPGPAAPPPRGPAAGPGPAGSGASPGPGAGPRPAGGAPPAPATPEPAGRPPEGAPRAAARGDGGTRFPFSAGQVALAASFPVMLLLGAVGYALCQRLIDGGGAMAWQGRGRPDDTLIEF